MLIGAADYRSGAQDRLEEAYILLRQERFGGSIYLAGRAVESMLRAVIWNSDPDYSTGKKVLEVGHQLRDMLKLVRNLGVLRDREIRDQIAENVQKIARLWWNNMRFIPSARIRTSWYNLGEIGGKRTMKQASEDFFNACSSVIKRCEALWQQKK